eukprot:CAMPEP_0175987184 /NCGR_PEP_ID=MMETSP0108-20121206/50568_1 /TAXON_ID=195067 ORGANISM="Goniomonas pacifica, Strain CCMP1869" /NCGR_SAMPLE_ID=MMETSP0108 /ASSEMBLY_ACC=CAM_ASM_000204 /LENGTH=249 /DNA_ID=CAMNT_0017318433 /DNA_START=156 /DNA_END=904 /DNA_ORIENTATION=+
MLLAPAGVAPAEGGGGMYMLAPGMDGGGMCIDNRCEGGGAKVPVDTPCGGTPGSGAGPTLRGGTCEAAGTTTGRGAVEGGGTTGRAAVVGGGTAGDCPRVLIAGETACKVVVVAGVWSETVSHRSATVPPSSLGELGSTLNRGSSFRVLFGRAPLTDLLFASFRRSCSMLLCCAWCLEVSSSSLAYSAAFTRAMASCSATSRAYSSAFTLASSSLRLISSSAFCLASAAAFFTSSSCALCLASSSSLRF